MNLNLEAVIDDFNDHSYYGINESIKEGFIGYAPNSSTLRLVDSTNFSTITEVTYPSNLMFQFNSPVFVLSE